MDCIQRNHMVFLISLISSPPKVAEDLLRSTGALILTGLGICGLRTLS